MDWDQIKDIVRFWIGWHVLDWLKPAAWSAVVTVGGWLIARYRKSPWQRELRGAAIGFIVLTIAMVLFASQPKQWLVPADAINAFVPAAIRKDLPEASEALRQQLQSGELIARAYDQDKGEFVEILTEYWQFLAFVIRDGKTGGHLPGLNAEAGGGGHHFVGVELTLGNRNSN
jgi:hypothetical protein